MDDIILLDAIHGLGTQAYLRWLSKHHGLNPRRSQYGVHSGLETLTDDAEQSAAAEAAGK